MPVHHTTSHPCSYIGDFRMTWARCCWRRTSLFGLQWFQSHHSPLISAMPSDAQPPPIGSHGEATERPEVVLEYSAELLEVDPINAVCRLV